MKVAVMMRAMDHDTGFRTLTHSWVKEMVRDETVSFVLLYRTRKRLGEFASHPNVKELLTESRSTLLWDQVLVPYHAWREKADVIFDPKFFVPLISPCPVTMGLQEPAWFTRPQEYALPDRLYQKLMIPISIRKCAHVFPNSRFILEENRSVLQMPIRHSTVAYSAAHTRFKPVGDSSALEAFRRKYNLPAKFVVVPTRVMHNNNDKMFFPGKNPEIAYRAFMRIRDRVPHELVFAGHRVREYLEHTEGTNADFDRVRFVSFVPFEEVHLLYNAADVFVNPCVYEGCPNTVLQAMACGRPVVVANAGGSADVGAGAAVLAAPCDVDDLADKLLAVITDDALRADLRARSVRRAACFTWERTARDTLRALRGVVEGRYIPDDGADEAPAPEPPPDADAAGRSEDAVRAAGK
jgi:glycosyltransferase involved in cell wall biosynthesis